MPIEPVSGPADLIRDLLGRVEQIEREGLWPLPWGVVAVAERSTAETPQMGARTVMSVQTRLLARRRYRLSVTGRVGTVPGNAVGWLTVTAPGWGTVTVGRWWTWTGTTAGVEHTTGWTLWRPASSQTVTVAAVLDTSAAFQFAADSEARGLLVVEDVGPAAG